MAVLAEYRAPAPPGYAVRLGIQAYETGSSIMARKQQLRLMEQQQNLQQMEFIAKLPLLQAQAQLVTENARSAIATGVQQTNLEARAALESPVAQKEFQDILQYYAVNDSADYRTIDPEKDSPERQAELASSNEEIKKYATRATLETRSNRMAALMTKYSYMGNLKNAGYEGFLDTIKKAYVQTNEQLHAIIGYDTALARAQGSAEAHMYGADRSLEGRIYAADKTLEGAEANAASRVESAKERSQRTYELETTMKLREEARQRRDVEAFAIYDARLKKLNHIPQSAGEAVANALAGPGEAPPSPSETSVKPTVSADKYTRGVIYKDPKGKRAKYLGNGQWQPLD